MIITAIKSIWHNKDLCLKIAQREVLGRYKGSILGILWPFIQQLLMLIAYTVVFGYIFKSRWPGLDESPFQLAVVIYSGLIPFNFFSEVVSRSSTIIVNNTNYVKRVVFPLEILPVSVVVAALLNFVIGVLILLGAEIVFGNKVEWNNIAMIIPVVLPLAILALGIGYIISSTCLFIRDVEQVAFFLTSLLLFATPIFYPVSSLPESFRWILSVSPIAFAVDSIRDIVVYNKLPILNTYFMQLIFSVLFFLVSLVWFERLKKGFSDVA